MSGTGPFWFCFETSVEAMEEEGALESGRKDVEVILAWAKAEKRTQTLIRKEATDKVIDEDYPYLLKQR